MLHQRNVEGLRENAQKKRQEAIERTEQGIRQLLKEGRSINFKTVASVSNVSTAWLYKEPEIKARIEHLREQGTQKKSVPPQQKATDASGNAKYQALKKRLQEVEAENRGLRNHLEAVHGRQRVLADENEIQSREIEQLTKFLKEALVEIESLKQGLNIYEYSSRGEDMSRQVEAAKLKSKVTPLLERSTPHQTITDRIKSELNGLNISLNSTLTKTIKNSDSEQKTLLAIEAFKEAKSKGEVPNPIGFLVRAIKEGWMPNEKYEQKVELDIFNEWYSLAKKCGVAFASQKTEDGIMIYTNNENWVLFQKMLDEYPLEKLDTKYYK